MTAYLESSMLLKSMAICLEAKERKGKGNIKRGVKAKKKELQTQEATCAYFNPS